jgi:hypothetical protein
VSRSLKAFTVARFLIALIDVAGLIASLYHQPGAFHPSSNPHFVATQVLLYFLLGNRKPQQRAPHAKDAMTGAVVIAVGDEMLMAHEVLKEH